MFEYIEIQLRSLKAVFNAAFYPLNFLTGFPVEKACVSILTEQFLILSDFILFRNVTLL